MYSDSYPLRVRQNILPLSVGDNLPDAFAEWRFTGSTTDYEAPIEVCQLCGKDKLRYHFEIINGYTNNVLEVGSHCILKFDLAVYVDGQRLSLDAAEKHLHKLTQKMQLESCLLALEACQNGAKFDSKRSTGVLQKGKKLTPKYAFVVFWRLIVNNIDHRASFFSINLKKQRYIDDLAEMPTSRVHVFWQALTPAQRNKAIELGHTPPKV